VARVAVKRKPLVAQALSEEQAMPSARKMIPLLPPIPLPLAVLASLPSPPVPLTICSAPSWVVDKLLLPQLKAKESCRLDL
jgi:hypothetical protein